MKEMIKTFYNPKQRKRIFLYLFLVAVLLSAIITLEGYNLTNAVEFNLNSVSILILGMVVAWSGFVGLRVTYYVWLMGFLFYFYVIWSNISSAHDELEYSLIPIFITVPFLLFIACIFCIGLILEGIPQAIKFFSKNDSVG